MLGDDGLATFLVRNSNPLQGSIRINGSKNAALPILAASILAENGQVVLSSIPDLTDVRFLCEILQGIGCTVAMHADGKVTVDASRITNHITPYDLASRMRGSFLVMGPMLARMGICRISLPGGCPIGSRPVDLHMKGLRALGAKVTQGYGYIEVRAKKLIGNKIYLDFPSVGATENILMAAVRAAGETVIENAAVEPEVVDLANFLCAMGADITGAGTDSITIQGVSALHGAQHTVIPDRIEAGSFMAAAAITRGHITLSHVLPAHVSPVSAKLREMGVDVREEADQITLDATRKFHAVDIKTLPFPGFPTDMQAQLMALLSLTEGTSIIVETIFENRFMHAPELQRMGAHIKVEGRTAVIEGVRSLSGAPVRATDLRAGAALVLAGLAAKGDTEISDIHHIERGYADFAGRLRSLGADIHRID